MSDDMAHILYMYIYVYITSLQIITISPTSQDYGKLVFAPRHTHCVWFGQNQLSNPHAFAKIHTQARGMGHTHCVRHN